ncbi:baseplate wedge subunit [Erwinia phage Cronus]|uniref:Baseplate wedge protein gp7 n=1 Tax=Erwinia phage Cronus TaxID=2163633 RepID=A0A2S1GLT1_9CAUD|nr:baseplate wedge subunit [Erwinia phage Cronus]AWD90303.1 baseplate wedge initiator [Erwinia phage Cronus]
MTIKAPFVTSLRIGKLSANQVLIQWDSVGSNFYYFVEIAQTRDQNGVELSTSDYQWRNLGYTPDNDWFEETYITPLSYFKMRVSVAAEGFDRSDWVTTEEFQTFETNAYTFEMMNELTLVNKFISEKFTKNNTSYVDFNTDTIVASLMNESFQFSTEYSDISSISNYIVSEDEYHEIQGEIEKVCVDKDRTMLAEIDGVLYLFERFQPVVKVSQDKGQNWYYVKLFNDRVGNPVSRTCIYQSVNTSYVLGYDRIFYGRQSNDVRWSADDVRFSSQDVTFAQLGDQLHLGFDVEIFGTYARLPGDVAKYAEALACTDDNLYVVSRDTVRYVKLSNAPIDTDPTSTTFGEKLFETDVLNITGNDKAVCYKMDSINNKLYALITGEVKSYGLDPTVPANVIDSESKGVYILDGDKFVRIFGNTEEERRRIEHTWTNMSTNGDEIFFNSADFRFNNLVADPETVAKYSDHVTSAVKYIQDIEFHHQKHYNMMSFRAGIDSDYRTFTPGRMRYYAEPWFNYMRRSGGRNWINNSNHAVVVYNDVIFQKNVENYGPSSPSRITHEVWNKGEATFTMPNVNFNGFIKYASGVMFHKTSGELIAFYQFNYRVRDDVDILWKPKNIFFTAELQNQTHETPWTPETDSGLRDPDLRPLLNKMMPDAYLLEDSNFEKFSEYYLQFLSDGYGTSYNNLLNLIRNKYPREEHAWEYLWSEVYKRNIYLDKARRDEVSRFFESRRSDFYSTKGIEDSYKFLFRLLYNEDVEIDIESKNTTEYDIIVDSNNVSQDLIGRTIYTPSGRCNVTYVERSYVKGKLQWTITIHNMLGRFIVGQEVKSENSAFEGMIVRGVRGKELISNSIDYINRDRSYYVMRIRSVLPTSRWKNDVLRFVHPVGFGFIGVTLLTMFINVGLTMKHTETIINMYKNYRFDAGIPTMWPDRIASLDANGNIEHDPINGKPLYLTSPNAGKEFPVPDDYNEENNDSMLWDLNPTERRRDMSPLFDQSAVTFSQFRDLVNKRLKDDIGNPRDPSDPTQVLIDE